MALPFLRNPFRRSAEPERLIVRRLDAAAGGRRGTGMGTFGTINAEVGAGAHLVRSRARYLAANHAFLSNGTANWVAALVGSGIRPNPKADTTDLRQLASRAFERWADDADLAGRTDLWGLQSTIVRHLVVDGEALLILHDTTEGLRLQIVPPEQLDETKTGILPGGGEIVAGVEFNAIGQRVAYWIMPVKPSSIYAEFAPSVRVDAADVCHVFAPLAAGQVRGLSWLAPAVLTASELDQLMDALLVGAKVSAMFAGFVTDLTGTGGMASAFPDAADGADISLEPGTMRVLPPGVDVKFAAPEAAKDAPAFLRANLQALAAALGLPEHLLSGDLSNANYSSLRAGLLPFRARCEQVQYGVLVPQLLRPIWRRWLALEVASGRLDLPADLGCDWIVPRPAQVDPEKDMAAAEKALSLGLTSRSQAVAEQGWSVTELDEEIAADRARETALGLTFGNGGGA